MNAPQPRIGDWMQTYTGKKFWPLDPRPEEIDIADIAHALAHLCRYGGHCLRFYSVAEHSVLMAEALPPELRAWALLHDASEAYLVDVPRPIKRSLPEYERAEATLMWNIAERFDLGPCPDTVHGADNLILFDERAQNMKPTDHVWSLTLRGSLGVTLQFWPPDVAEQRYLDTFARLQTEGWL